MLSRRVRLPECSARGLGVQADGKTLMQAWEEIPVWRRTLRRELHQKRQQLTEDNRSRACSVIFLELGVKRSMEGPVQARGTKDGSLLGAVECSASIGPSKKRQQKGGSRHRPQSCCDAVATSLVDPIAVIYQYKKYPTHIAQQTSSAQTRKL